MIEYLSPPDATLTQSDIVDTVNELLNIYPDDPSQGSPFGTGNQTFGLSSQFKREAAILGDLMFFSLRRELSQVLSDGGVKVFSYLFTDPQYYTLIIVNGSVTFTPAPPYLGGE